MVKALVIGGTQFIGRHLVQTLLKRRPRRGHPAPQAGTRPRPARGQLPGRPHAIPRQVRAALNGHTFDAVFDLAYRLGSVGTPGRGRGRDRALPHRQRRPLRLRQLGGRLRRRAEPPRRRRARSRTTTRTRYVRNSGAQSERALFRLFHRHGTPITTIRPPFVYGPGNPDLTASSSSGTASGDKRPIILPGDGRRLMQFRLRHGPRSAR